MVRSNAIEIVCGDLYSAKVNFAGDRPYNDPYFAMKVMLDNTKFSSITQSSGMIHIEREDDTNQVHIPGKFEGTYSASQPFEMTFNIKIVDGVLDIPVALTRGIIPVRTDYDIFVSVPTDDPSLGYTSGYYTPVYRNVIEFLPRTNKIL